MSASTQRAAYAGALLVTMALLLATGGLLADLLVAEPSQTPSRRPSRGKPCCRQRCCCSWPPLPVGSAGPGGSATARPPRGKPPADCTAPSWLWIPAVFAVLIGGVVLVVARPADDCRPYRAADY